MFWKQIRFANKTRIYMSTFTKSAGNQETYISSARRDSNISPSVCLEVVGDNYRTIDSGVEDCYLVVLHPPSVKVFSEIQNKALETTSLRRPTNLESKVQHLLSDTGNRSTHFQCIRDGKLHYLDI
uniref:Uncharacterized protein n=1 Tax=Arion vulgaris TaxID=1028688 RepID=A0A0B7BG73_9EUPU